jgi:hypothetical protein
MCRLTLVHGSPYLNITVCFFVFLSHTQMTPERPVVLPAHLLFISIYILRCSLWIRISQLTNYRGMEVEVKIFQSNLLV